MEQTTVVNKYKEPYDVLIMRPSMFGNPYRIEGEYSREDVITFYEIYFRDRVETDTAFRQAVLGLRGKRLGCVCKPKACHGDVIVKWLTENSQ
jgi:hypothetical protein